MSPSPQQSLFALSESKLKGEMMVIIMRRKTRKTMRIITMMKTKKKKRGRKGKKKKRIEPQKWVHEVCRPKDAFPKEVLL